MLGPMADMLKLIWWAVVGLFRSRASLEAENLRLELCGKLGDGVRKAA